MKSLLFVFASFLISTGLMAQDYAIDQLENSPRHHEWVEVEYDGRTVHSFVAYPETNEETLAVIVIHENRGLNNWARSFTDQVAEAGYIAIAPDLLSGFSDEYEKTSDFPTSDAAREALYTLDPGQITQDLKAVQEYILNVPASDGEVVVAGFCWGGSQTFRFATNSDVPEAFMVFYGSAPDNPEAVQNISAPVYGFYGENDQRINSGIPDIERMMEEYGKTYEYEIYDGAGHAFMRAGDDPDADPASKAARDAAWDRLKGLLEDISM
ncbi:MAG: dienelactone hydrolase family protein [Balneolaceae bacterium]|nr:dienelactone hydrolase family protein [Balneolaceae bacterium]